jgi:hypothetical protein
LLVVLLRHSSFRHDSSVLLPLLQASKQLQEAAADIGFGQLPLRVSLKQQEHAASFFNWLARHGGLLQELQLNVVRRRPFTPSGEAPRPSMYPM